MSAMLRSNHLQRRVSAAVILLGALLVSGGCRKAEEEPKGPGGTKLPQYMSETEKVNAIKSNPRYSDAEKQQAIKNLEMQAQLSRGEGGSNPPPGYKP